MVEPYFELSLGEAAALIGFKINGPGRLYLDGGQMYGEANTQAGSMAVQSSSAYGLTMEKVQITRWETGVGGTVANGSNIVIREDVEWGNCTYRNKLRGTEFCEAAYMVPPPE